MLQRVTDCIIIIIIIIIININIMTLLSEQFLQRSYL